MAKLQDLKNSTRTARPDAPFSRPSNDETIELLIPEGAETGQIPVGKYPGKLLSVTKDVSKKRDDGSGGNPMLVWVFTIVDGPYVGMDFTMWTALTPNSLWKLSDTLKAIGVAYTPGEKFAISNGELKGTLVLLDIIDDKMMNGRKVSKLSQILPSPDGAGTKGKGKARLQKAEEPDEEEEEEEAVPARRALTKTAPKNEDDEDEDDEADDKDEWPVPAALPPKRKKAVAPVEEEDEDEDDETEDDEQDEPPRRGRPPTRGRNKSRL